MIIVLLRMTFIRQGLLGGYVTVVGEGECAYGFGWVPLVSMVCHGAPYNSYS